MRLYEQSKVLLLAHPFSMSSLDWPRPGDDTNAYDPTLWGSSAPHAPSFHLFVRSNADEFLATLEAVPLLRYPWWPQRLVITEYTREEAVMAHFEPPVAKASSFSSLSAAPPCLVPNTTSQGFLNYATVRCLRRPGDPQNYREAVKKVANFVSWLRSRNKAGVIFAASAPAASSSATAIRIFVLPGRDDSVGELRLIRMLVYEGQKNIALNPNRSDVQGSNTIVGASTSNISNSVEAQRAVVKRRLAAFAADEDADRLEFGVTNDMGCYIIEEEVQEFRGELLDVEEMIKTQHGEGEMFDEKHIVVYKKNGLPHEVAVKLGLARTQDSGKAADEEAAKERAAMAAQRALLIRSEKISDLQVERIGQVKRDRRTAQEIIDESDGLRSMQKKARTDQKLN